MPKILNDHAFVLFFQQFSAAQRLVASTSLVMLMTIFWSMFLYIPLSREIKKVEEILQKLKHENQLCDTACSQSLYYSSANEQLKKKLQTLQSESLRLRDGLSRCLQSAQNNNVHCTQIKPLSPKNTSLFNKEFYTVLFYGKYDGVHTFLTELCQNASAITIDRIELRRAKMGFVDLSLVVENIHYHQGLFDYSSTFTRPPFVGGT